MKRVWILTPLFVALLMAVGAKKIPPASQGMDGSVDHKLWDGNNISTWHGNHGDFVSYHVTGNSGLEWPKGSGKHAIFQSGLWLAAGKVDGQQEIRTAIAEYTCEFVPGSWGGEPDDPAYRIYEINEDDGPGSQAWQEWPVVQGAPWVDANGDGAYDPSVDRPDVIGRKTHWYVMNDRDTSAHAPLFKTESLGVEVHVSLFGFDHYHPLENVIFIRYLIINKGQHDLDSVFVGFWSDPDVGSASDDLIGSDSTLGLSYAYNDFDGDEVYGLRVPAEGMIILQGPMVWSPGDTASMFGRTIQDYRNLPMTSSAKLLKFHPWGLPEDSDQVFRVLQALATQSTRWSDVSPGDPMINPVTGQVTKWAFTGRPWLGEGWIDGSNPRPGDRRHLPASGPFSLAHGDSQEVVMALILSRGREPFLAIPALMEDAGWVYDTWDSKFERLGAPFLVEKTGVPDNTEELGPFEMVFSFESNPGWNLSLADVRLHYALATLDDSMVLERWPNGGMPVYRGIVPSFPKVTGTMRLMYYLSFETTDGIQMTWPSGSPPNYNILVFGPDTVAPTIHYVTHGLQNVHYLLPFQKPVVARVSDDRFGVSPKINWRIDDRDAHSSSMNLSYVYSVYSHSDIWFGTFTDVVGDRGDTVFYWVTAKDSSTNANISVSDVYYFIGEKFEVIGNWEHATWENEALEFWDRWNHWAAYDSVVPEWRSVRALKDLPVGETDTMAYNRPLDLTRFDEAWITIPMRYDLAEGENFGYFELSGGGTDWVIVDTLTGFFPPQKVHYPLTDFLGTDSVYIRFRAERRSDGPCEWVMDDIILHSDSNRLALESRISLPREFTLHQNYPNPFNPVTTIRYDLPEAGEVGLVIYDILGREVTTLIDAWQQAGQHEVTWHAGDVASGIYIVKMRSADFSQTKKLMVLR